MTDLRISMKQIEGVNAIDNSIFKEYKAKYVQRFIVLVLDTIYTLLVFRHGEYSLAHFVTGFFGATCAISAIAKGWNLYTEHREFRRFEKMITETMQEFHFESGKEEDCGICMEKMKTARKLRCNHCFHQYCLMQMILNKKTTCPICREDLYQGVPAAQRHPEPRPRPAAELRRDRVPPPTEQRPEPIPMPQPPQPQVNIGLNQHVIGNIMQNVFLPFNLGGNVPQVGEADIERVREIYPNIPREQVVQEILRAGSVEQAILNIAERLE